MSTLYTTGNWKVESLTTDHTTTAKSVSVTDLDYASDFSKTEDEPAEAVVKNITASEMTCPEQIRYGRKDVSNVYTNSNVRIANQPLDKGGVQALVELKFNLRATNTVSAAEVELPFTVRTVVIAPTTSAVTDDALTYALKRGIATLFSTGSTGVDRLKQLMRGTLVPE